MLVLSQTKVQKESKTVLRSHALSSLKEVRHRIQLKIGEELIRFRTCCADPRASK